MDLDINKLMEQSRKPFEMLTPEGFNAAWAVPAGYEVKDIEFLAPAPSRKRAAVTLGDAESFIYYTKKHGSLDCCTIYAETDYEAQKAGLVAIINDHGSLPEAARWRDHTAAYVPTKTVEWKTWNGNNGPSNAMTQEEFANFLEENMGDIAAVDGMPTGTDMLRMATEFEANADKRFKSKVNVQGGGVNLIYVDQDNAETQATMRLFERFSLGLRVFLNGAAYRLDARLKYRQNGGKLVFWFELIRPDRVFEDALKGELAKIRAETGFPILIGKAK